jgi:NADH dehydrogenase
MASSSDQPNGQRHVVIVGAGFAGLGCARRLRGEDSVHVTLIDQHNYHQFQPLLYLVATAQLSSTDISYSLRKPFAGEDNVDVKLGNVVEVDTENRAVVTDQGEKYEGDFLVMAAGGQANFFNTPGAAEHAFPLYSVADAQQLRARILTVFEDADRNPELIDRGALNFVIVGAGATGTELAEALADMINETMPIEYQDLAVNRATVEVVDLGEVVLNGFSDKAHSYASKVLEDRGVKLTLSTGVKEIGPDHVVLSDGTTIQTHCAVWAGGLKAASAAAASGLPTGRGERIDVNPDLTVGDAAGVHAAGDVANIPGPDGKPYPQLGAVALQSGVWVAENILAEVAGKPRKDFHYHDKGIMAMIGRGAAVAEVGPPPRASRLDRLRRLARRPRRPVERRAQPHRGIRRLGLGLLLQDPRADGPRRARQCGADQVG